MCKLYCTVYKAGTRVQVQGYMGAPAESLIYGCGDGVVGGWGALVPLPFGAGGRKPLPITMLRLSLRRKSFYPH